MTTIQLYRKHKAGEISKEKFLYEVRRDNNLPFITNLTSYEDAVKILKNKGIVTEETPAIVGTPAIGLMTEAKEAKKELTLDTVNPYEYRHGLQHELEQMDEYNDEALEKAKSIVLKNLAKDANFYSNLLNQKPSPYEFKSPETDAKGMQAKADGYLKKELKKDEKANVQDSLGKKEEGSKKPKGVKVMPDKGVEGKEKVVKEGLDEDSKDPYDKVKVMKVKDKFEVYTTQDGKIKTFDTEAEAKEFADKMNKKGMKEIMPGVNLGASFDKLKGEMNAEDEFNSLLSKYDWYYEMSDDPRTYDRGIELDKKLAMLGKQIGVDKAVELFNAKAPSDRKITTSFFMEGKAKGKFFAIFDKARGEEVDTYETEEEAQAALDKINKEDPYHGDYVIDDNTPKDKHAKLKEILKKKVKEAIYKKAGSGGKEDLALASSPKSKSELTKKGYMLVPGTEDAIGLK